MNIIQIAGHLGSDPEVRFTPSNQKVTTFRVGCNSRSGKDQETIWWRVNIWGDRFSKMLTHLKKGSAVVVIGTISKPKAYTSKDGTQQVSLDINAEMISFSPFGRSEGESKEPIKTTGSPSVFEQDLPF